jgi:hypothetical protein
VWMLEETQGTGDGFERVAGLVNRCHLGLTLARGDLKFGGSMMEDGSCRCLRTESGSWRHGGGPELLEASRDGGNPSEAVRWTWAKAWWRRCLELLEAV